MDLKTLVAAILVATGWMLFYSMIGGLIWFGQTAASQTQKCVDTYKQYIEEVDKKCTIKFGEAQSNEGIGMYMSLDDAKEILDAKINITQRINKLTSENYTITEQGLVSPNGSVIGTLANLSS